ncbi:hypothetical protein ACFUTV_21920 [Streptomyces sp. NPDC057298]|uniref:hypothetical protein n=1 Tax=Streptomyces sp. NPDC057298 TaxID=3346091 RepID=UPI00363EEB55
MHLLLDGRQGGDFGWLFGDDGPYALLQLAHPSREDAALGVEIVEQSAAGHVGPAAIMPSVVASKPVSRKSLRPTSAIRCFAWRAFPARVDPEDVDERGPLGAQLQDEVAVQDDQVALADRLLDCGVGLGVDGLQVDRPCAQWCIQGAVHATLEFLPIVRNPMMDL